MSDELDRIKRQLEKAWDKQPWYGTSIMGILKNVNPSIVHKKFGPHSIVILLLHMTMWRHYVTSKLLGDDEFKVTEELNFREPPATPESWTKALKEFGDSQKELMRAIGKFDSTRLHELVPAASHKYTWYTLLHGIIQHDVYHLGQIALLNKGLQ
jgi:uncharacterized damage-inducible protein DinB